MSIDDFLPKYERMTNTHDFDQVGQLIDEDAVFWFSSGSYSGKAAIRAAFERTWDMIKEERYTIKDVTCIARSEGTASYMYTFYWEGVIDGKFAQGKGRGTSVIIKRGIDWKVIHEHLSAFPSVAS
jgi:ketosteroid isomerase-like protein